MEKKIVLVTGATSGIGRHAAVFLAGRGHTVLATGRNVEALAELQREAADLPLSTLRMDVTDAASIAEAVREVDRRTDSHGVDVLVSNAARGMGGALTDVDDEHLRAVFETNVFGTMAVIRAFVPAMQERGSGRLINISSMGGRITFPFLGAYHGTKYALEGMSDALRRELAMFGIDVVLIEPGYVRSKLLDKTMETMHDASKDGSPYRHAYARADKLAERTRRIAAGPAKVSRAIAKAIDARRPQARYVVTRNARAFLTAFKILPTRWVDALLKRMYGLRPGDREDPEPASSGRHSPAHRTDAP